MQHTTNARFSVLIIAAALVFSFLGSCKKEQKSLYYLLQRIKIYKSNAH
jgi:hypothetical protein